MRLRACTALIAAGDLPAADLASAYYARGICYELIGLDDLAIADITSSCVRLLHASVTEENLMKTLIGVVGTALLAGTVACSQYTSATGPNTFRGCLQGDAAKGYALLSPTGDGSGADTKGQTMTYKVVPTGSDIDLANMVNKTVEIDGSVSTEKSETGSMPAPVTDTVRGTGGSGGAGQPGVNTAFYFANGTLSARSIRELEPTCAVRFAPDRDESVK